jgi:hypothetical protein
MPIGAEWTGRAGPSAFANPELRNADAARGFASLAVYQSVLELPQAGPTQVSLRDVAIIALSLSAFVLILCFPASQVLLIALAAVFIGARNSWHRVRSPRKLVTC